MFKTTIHFAQNCHILGEPLIGTVEMVVTSPTRMTYLSVEVEGISETDYTVERTEERIVENEYGQNEREFYTVKERVPVTHVFFISKPFNILDKKYLVEEKSMIELPP